jgi:hypothetical protein
VLLALLLAQLDGYAHAETRLDAPDGTIKPTWVFRSEARAKTSANPKNILGFDEHAAGAHVARARVEARRAPLNLEIGLIAVTGRPASIRLARLGFFSVHGPDDSRDSGAQMSSPCSVPYIRRYDRSVPNVSDTCAHCFVPGIFELDTENCYGAVTFEGRRHLRSGAE